VLLADVCDEATTAFEGLDYARSLERTERFFWQFCDDYVELVKGRAYGGRGEDAAASAAVALRAALSTLLRLLAPILPFVTEESWSWWHDDSVHCARWPDASSLRDGGGRSLHFDVASEVIALVRKCKSEQKRSLATPATSALVRDTAERLEALREVQDDVMEAGKITSLETVVADALSVDVELAAPEA
jgi:valyl-tRNA synthetase